MSDMFDDAFPFYWRDTYRRVEGDVFLRETEEIVGDTLIIKKECSLKFLKSVIEETFPDPKLKEETWYHSNNVHSGGFYYIHKRRPDGTYVYFSVRLGIPVCDWLRKGLLKDLEKPVETLCHFYIENSGARLVLLRLPKAEEIRAERKTENVLMSREEDEPGGRYETMHSESIKDPPRRLLKRLEYPVMVAVPEKKPVKCTGEKEVRAIINRLKKD